MISILHPSRLRPQQSAQTLKRWIERAAFPKNIEVIVSIDEDDPTRDNYITIERDHGIIVNKNRNAIDAINEAAKMATGDIFIVVSDDTDCPDLWDAKILEEVAGKEDWILKCRDGIQDWLITMTVMDRKYYNRFGYIYYPGYDHLWADTELTAVGDLTGRTIKSDLLFPHLHYSIGEKNGGVQKDQLNERNDKTWKQGESLFMSRLKNKFGLKDATGKIKVEKFQKLIQ